MRWLLVAAALGLSAGCERFGFEPGADAAPPVRETWTLGETPGATVRGVTADTWMCDFDPGDDVLNWGASERFEGGVFCTGLLRFDLTALPAGATVIEASVEVSPESVPAVDGHVDVYRVTEAWYEGVENGAPGAASYLERQPGVAWTTPGGRPPGSAEPTPVHQFSVTAIDAQVIPLPVALVQSWIDAPSPNSGLGFVGVGYGNPDTEHPHFLSRESPQAEMRPLLTITFEQSS